MTTLADYEKWKATNQQHNIAAANVVMDSIDAKPDEAAGDLNLAHEFAKTTGNPVPPATLVQEYRSVFQQAIEREKNKTILSSSPRLAEWLRNPENAAVAKDDLTGLSWFEAGLGAAGNAMSRGVKRVPQSWNQFLASSAAERSNDQGKSFGEIFADQQRSIELMRDGRATGETVKEAAGPLDLPFAAARFAQSRLSSALGIDEQKSAAAFQQAVGQINKRIGEIPLTPDASKSRDAWAGVSKSGGDFMDYMAVIGNNPAGFVSFVTQTAIESLPMMAAATGVGLVTRSSKAGAIAMGSMSGAQEYGTAPVEFFQEKGIDVSTPAGAMKVISDPQLMQEAAQRGVIRGVVVGAMDGLSGGVAGQMLAKSRVGNMVLQALTQAAMGSAGEAGAQMAAGQKFDLGAVLLEGLAEFTTAPIEVAGMGGSRLMDGVRKAKDATDRKTLFEELSGQAQSSILRGRMPDKFRQFVEAATANGPVENVYVPADQFVQYFQGIGVDPRALVDELDGLSADDLDAALAAGGDLQIPTATYAARIAGSAHDAFLMENMRFDPDQFTSREAAEFNAKAQEALQEAYELAEQVRQESEALRSHEQEIYDQMVSRLRAAGRSTDVATTEAMLYPAFYRVMAERSGMTTEDFMRQYPLPAIRGDLPEGMQLRNVDALTRTLAEARARKAVGLDKRRTLLEFIADHGGIVDRGGELRARDAEVIKRGPGKKTLRLARKGATVAVRDMFGGGGKKFSADEVARAAIEAGYMADDPVVQDYKNAVNEAREVPDITMVLWENIDRELKGESVRAGEADAATMRADDLDQIEAYLNGLGVSLDEDDAVIRTAIEADQAEGRQYAQASNKGRDIPTGPDGRTMLFDRIAEDWSNHAQRILDGTARREMEVLRESAVLAAVAGGRGKVLFSPIVARAVKSKHPDIPAAVWMNLPSLLADPMFAFVRSDGNMNVVIDAATEIGSPIVVGIRDGEIRTITPMDGNASESARERLGRVLSVALSRTGKVYAKSEAALAEVPVRTGANSPGVPSTAVKEGLSRQERKAKLLTRPDVVKAAGRIFYQSGGPGPRGAIQFPAGGVGSGDTIIRLFETADLSTVIHESGHYFLTVMQDMAGRGEAGASSDMTVVRDWWRSNAAAVAADGARVMQGVEITAEDVLAALDQGTTGDVMKDAAVDVGLQEQWARAFEAYLMDGKAPSIELRSAFEKFRAWLISVYRRLAGLNVNMSDDIRAVFDRMIATDAEIDKAKAEAGDTGATFTTAEQLGLSPEQFGGLMKLRAQAEDEAKARLLRETMAPVKRARERWFKEERAKVRDEMAAQVNALPYFRALEWMGNGRWLGEDQPTELPDMRLSKDVLVDRYGEGVLKTLPRGKRTIYTVEGGLDPDEAAGWFGFGSGDELIRAMERAPKRNDAIEAETDRVMRERHGDALHDGEIEAAALDAVHNDKRGLWIAAELKAIVEIAEAGKAMTAKEARATARQTIARMKTRDAMNANRFLAAERKAADEAARLGAMLARDGVWLQNATRRMEAQARRAAKGDATVDQINAAIDRRNNLLDSDVVVYEAKGKTRVSNLAGYNENVAKLLDAKRRQLLNHALYSEARKVADEVEKAERFVSKLGKASHRERIAGAGRRADAQIDYLGTIDDLLTQYDFRRLSAADEGRRGALNAFVAAMTAAGRENELAIPEAVLNNAARRPYKTLSVEELRGVVDTLKNLEHMALRWDDLIDAQNNRKLDEVVTDIVAAFDANVKKRPPGRVSTKGEGARNAVRQFFDLVLNASTLLREIDGFADDGAAYRGIKGPIDAAMNRLMVRKQQAATDLETLYAAYSKDERRKMAVRQHIPELGYALSKWERIAVALNTGNAGNYQRLTDQSVRGSLTPDQVKVVLATLDERDASFVQSAWDYIGSFRNDIAARERRVTGVEPQWVEATPVEIGGKMLAGGYYPIKYDPRLSSLARDDETQEIAKSLQAGRFGKAQTRNGHLKDRAQSSGRDVEFDISVMHRHVNQVIYDLELSEAVANSWRILQDGRIRASFIEAGKQPDFDALETWLKDVAEGELKSADFVGRAARVLKSNFTAAKLAFNFSTVAMQIVGVSQSAVVVGKKNMAVGIAKTVANPAGVAADIAAKSPFMASRQTTFNKDIFDFYSDSSNGPVASRWGEIKKEFIGPLSFWLMTKVQFFAADVPTWIAGYEQGMQKFGNDEAKAIAHADAIVKRAQSSGLFADRSAIERGSVTRNARQNDVVRLFTTLGSYMFAKFNVAYERTAKASRTVQDEGVSLKSAQEALSWTLDMAFLFTLEALLTAAIRGQLPKGDDEDDGWLKFLAKQTGLSIMSTVPFVRDVASPLQGYGGGGAYGSITDEVTKPLKAAAKGEVDKALVKSVIGATGLALGLPATQINRVVDARWRQADGEDVSPLEYLMGRFKK